MCESLKHTDQQTPLGDIGVVRLLGAKSWKRKNEGNESDDKIQYHQKVSALFELPWHH